MPAKTKLAVVAEIKERFVDCPNVLLVDYRGLDVQAVSQLRRELRESGGDMVVYKNTLTQIAMRELALPSMEEMLEGPSAFVFAQGDPVTSAKVLANFAKENEALELKGGLVQSQVIDSAGLKALATLPSRDELLAKLLGTISNPARGMATVLSGSARGLVTALSALQEQKEAA
ncbi:MAG: 50S ribosomal protein L10 [Coriobacteriia bacterium]|nr:50S ribosomal protein L10 [Coriobacteriia bacterium]MCL2606793.1 50S ribosomal protein L10 [Coriobacteriia bacterium]